MPTNGEAAVTTAASPPAISSVSPPSLDQAAIDQEVVLNGSGFTWHSTVVISGGDVSVDRVQYLRPTALLVGVTVANDAAIGPVDVTVTDDHGRSATCEGCFSITAPPSTTGTWAVSGAPAGHRSGHTATLLDGPACETSGTCGTVLVVGGWNAENGPVPDAELYDPADGAWDAADPDAEPSLRAQRKGHTSTLLDDGRVLLAGGGSFEAPSNAGEAFNPADGSWQQLPMLLARSRHTATKLNDGKVLVVGGVQRVNNRKVGSPTVEIFTPGTQGSPGAWAPGVPMVVGRYGHTATPLADGKVLVTGGLTGDDDAALSVAELFDPVNGIWKPVRPMAFPRALHAAMRLDNGRILVTGGQAANLPGTVLASAEIYDPVRDEWKAAPDMVEPRVSHAASRLPNGSVLIAGGGDSRSADLYESSATERAVTPDMHASRSELSATVLEGPACTRMPAACGKVLTLGDATYPNSDETLAHHAELFVPPGSPAPPEMPLTRPLLRGLSVEEGASEGGTLVKIRGTSFSGVSAVQFGDTPAPQFNVESSTVVAAVAPPAPEGCVAATDCTVQVVVVARGGPTQPNINSEFVYDGGGEDFILGGIEPSGGSTWGGAPVSLSGTGLARTVTDVMFGEKEAPVVFRSDGLLIALSPPQPQGSVEITVGSAAGRRKAGTFNYGPGSSVPAATLTKQQGTATGGRYLHTATSLQGPACVRSPTACGKILVAGGTTFYFPLTPPVLSAVSLYDPTTDTWSRCPPDEAASAACPAPLSEARFNHTATLLTDGRVLVAGGEDLHTSAMASAEIYDPSTGSWSNADAMEVPRLGHTATLLEDGRVLVAGGVIAEQRRELPLATAEVYDPDSNTWSRTGVLQQGRSAHSATLLTGPECGVATAPSYCGMVMIAGGIGTAASVPRLGEIGQAQSLATAELYDPRTQRWTATEALDVDRFAHTATLLANGRVLVAGGGNSSTEGLASAEVYTPATGAWEPTAMMEQGRLGHTATELPGGSILVAGGATPIPAVSDDVAKGLAEVYDPSTGDWVATDSLLSPRGAHTATALPDGTVLMVGGYTTRARSPLIEHYVPSLVERYVPAPEVRSIEPPRGPVNGGTEVVVRGLHLGQVQSVRFGAQVLVCPGPACDVVAPDRVVVRLPAAPMGPVRVTAVGLGGTSAAPGATFTYVDRPRAVEDLVARAVSSSEVELAFSAPEETATTGVTRYDVRQAPYELRAENFAAAPALCGGLCTVPPVQSGGSVRIAVTDLQPGTTYHYAVSAVNDVGLAGPVSNEASATTSGTPAVAAACQAIAPEEGQLTYPARQYVLIGLPEGTLVPSSPLYSWFDQGAGGRYSTRAGIEPVSGGKGYWAWSPCQMVVTPAGGSSSVRHPLGAYRASMVGNPSGVAAATVSGHDFSARWDPGINKGTGGYHISGYREAQPLPIGEGIWVFAFVETNIDIVAPG